MADTAGGELLAHLRSAAVLVQDLEAQADLMRDGHLFQAVRDQTNVVAVTLHRIGRQASGRVREGDREEER